MGFVFLYWSANTGQPAEGGGGGHRGGVHVVTTLLGAKADSDFSRVLFTRSGYVWYRSSVSGLDPSFMELILFMQ